MIVMPIVHLIANIRTRLALIQGLKYIISTIIILNNLYLKNYTQKLNVLYRDPRIASTGDKISLTYQSETFQFYLVQLFEKQFLVRFDPECLKFCDPGPVLDFSNFLSPEFFRSRFQSVYFCFFLNHAHKLKS